MQNCHPSTPPIFTFVVLARPSSDVKRAARRRATHSARAKARVPITRPRMVWNQSVGGTGAQAASRGAAFPGTIAVRPAPLPPIPAMFGRRNPLWAPPAPYPRRERRTTCGGHVMGGLHRILARIRRSRRVPRCRTQALATGQTKKCAKRFGGGVGTLYFRPFPCIKSGFSNVASMLIVD